MNKDFCVLIPARSGSNGVRDKNIKKLYGHSLLEWSINAALKSKLIDRVFLSTDSKKYAEMGERYGAEAPFLRPAKISLKVRLLDNTTFFNSNKNEVNNLYSKKISVLFKLEFYKIYYSI